MNKRIFLTLVVLLTIFITVCIVVAIVGANKNVSATFSSNTNYTNKEQKTTTNDSDYYDIKKGSDLLDNLEENYTIWMTVGIISIIIFIFFYYFLTRKKEW